MVLLTGDRPAGEDSQVSAERGDGRGQPGADLQGGVRHPVHVHDRQESQERALLRQVH